MFKSISNSELPEGQEDTLKIAALLTNSSIRERVGVAAFDFYQQRGFIIEAGDFANTCRMLRIEESVLRKTIEDYTAASNGETTDAYGKVVFPERFSVDDHFYLSFVTPARHYTMGGLKINTSSQVMSKTGLPVINLFAAGECSGGVHGANRLGGCGLLDNIVFGRISGKNAGSIGSVNSPPPGTPISIEVLERSPAYGTHWRVMGALPSVMGKWTAPLGARFDVRSSDGTVGGVYAVTAPMTVPGRVEILIPTGKMDMEPGDILTLTTTDVDAGITNKLVGKENINRESLSIRCQWSAVGVAIQLSRSGDILQREGIKGVQVYLDCPCADLYKKVVEEVEKCPLIKCHHDGTARVDISFE
eukprot:GHVO01016688.1.p1 GENE.GHVO01016688.1~~GHVO01016688.1.p1  ORF type:complete len:361 (+),score=92.68 GHVO01016688.1:1049-2131(+)